MCQRVLIWFKITSFWVDFSFWYTIVLLLYHRTNASVERKMSRGKVAQKQNQKGKVKLVEEGVEKNAKDKDKVDAKDKVDEMRGLVLSQVQEEGLKRAFARKAILSPRFVKLLLEKL